MNPSEERTVQVAARAAQDTLKNGLLFVSGMSDVEIGKTISHGLSRV
jgi:hypothetical protein